MERDDSNIKLYDFGMNDKDGRLIQIKMPAANEHEAISRVKNLIYCEHPADHPLNRFWLNAVEDYR